jgi:hypothetical protein
MMIVVNCTCIYNYVYLLGALTQRFITPRARMRSRGKAIGLSVVSTKIARSRDLGI